MLLTTPAAEGGVTKGTDGKMLDIPPLKLMEEEVALVLLMLGMFKAELWGNLGKPLFNLSAIEVLLLMLLREDDSTQNKMALTAF